MILEAKNISKSFKNGKKKLSVFKDLSLVINSGDLITIMGPSGAGKSTLLNILGTLDKPDTGNVLIDGKDTLLLSSNEISKVRNKQLGFVFQFHHLLPEFTAIENVLIPNQINGETGNLDKGKELLAYMGLEKRFDHFPSQLSGGERLRVAVVRALMNDPKIIMADEPTGNLDKSNSDKLIKLFKRINNDFKQAIIITTHNPDVASIGNKKYNLDKSLLSLIDRV
jgi:ABC-type lipoprotein export system ATPase subunit|tara:strand:- start:282 stop:956 length:675 start_codon:yes stop_codon:yes gene_type:complete